MDSVTAALWGLFGGFAIEGLDFYGSVRKKRRLPWRTPDTPDDVGPGAYVVATAIRLLIGAGLASASVATAQVSGAWGAVGIGAAAPAVLERLLKAVPLDEDPVPPARDALNGAPAAEAVGGSGPLVVDLDQHATDRPALPEGQD